MPEQMPTTVSKERISTGIKAVLFDVDGVLINSFDANLKFYQSLLVTAGYNPPTQEIYSPIFGKSRKEVITALTGSSSEETDKIFQLGIEKVFYPIDLVKMQPGAEDIIRKLGEKYKLGIVTSRLRANIDEIPDLQALEKYFQTIICFDDTTKHKPDPEPLSVACKNLGINPNEAVYVGDQETDIIAGKAAGMVTIFYGENPTGEANLHIASLVEIPNLVSQL